MKDDKKPAEYPSMEGYRDIVGMHYIDPFGSYTGLPLDEYEDPVQDADDL